MHQVILLCLMVLTVPGNINVMLSAMALSFCPVLWLVNQKKVAVPLTVPVSLQIKGIQKLLLIIRPLNVLMNTQQHQNTFGVRVTTRLDWTSFFSGPESETMPQILIVFLNFDCI